jgi:hypothetical protein
MKLDRKEILTALETISVAGEGKNMVESGAVQNVITFWQADTTAPSLLDIICN